MYTALQKTIDIVTALALFAFGVGAFRLLSASMPIWITLFYSSGALVWAVIIGYRTFRGKKSVSQFI